MAVHSRNLHPFRLPPSPFQNLVIYVTFINKFQQEKQAIYITLIVMAALVVIVWK